MYVTEDRGKERWPGDSIMYSVHRAISKQARGPQRCQEHIQEGSQARRFVRNSKGRPSAQNDWEKGKDKSSLGAGARTETKLQVPKTRA